jgi:hypothetical protein
MPRISLAARVSMLPLVTMLCAACEPITAATAVPSVPTVAAPEAPVLPTLDLCVERPVLCESELRWWRGSPRRNGAR